MNDHIAIGRWKRIHGSAQERHGILAGNDLDRTEGKLEKLGGILQEKYGHAHDKADKRLERRLQKYDQKYIAQVERARRMNKRQSTGW
jgi:uncharacterized protein YjbJ (UPF0337 family)